MKRQDPLQKATRRIETEGRKHSLCIYSATDDGGEMEE